MNEKLREVLDWEIDTGIKHIEEGEGVVPHFIAIDAESNLYCYMTPWSGEEEKDAIVELLRAEFRKIKAVGYVFVSEAWVLALEKGEQPPEGSYEHDPRRKEVLMCNMETLDGSHIHCNNVILREEGGVVVERGELREDGEHHGRFTNLLPREDSEARQFLGRLLGGQ